MTGARARGRIDWGEVRDRLARAMRADETALGSEQARRVMDERARRLAEPARKMRRAAGSHEALVFSVGRARYALPTQFVLEVAPLGQFTSLPGASDLLFGVASLRGDVLAIFQPRALFGGEAHDASERRWLVVCGERHAEFALLADAVHELRRLDEEEALAPLGSADESGGEYVRGVTADALLLLDGAKLLAEARLKLDQTSV
jgi:purine-binding chemotaxis protein CheW